MQSQVWPRKQACFCQGVQDDPRPAHPAATSTPHLRMSPSRFPQPSPHGSPVAALVVPLSPLWGTSAVGPLECPCASPPRGLCEGQPGAWEAQPCSACRFPLGAHLPWHSGSCVGQGLCPFCPCWGMGACPSGARPAPPAPHILSFQNKLRSQPLTVPSAVTADTKHALMSHLVPGPSEGRQAGRSCHVWTHRRLVEAHPGL